MTSARSTPSPAHQSPAPNSYPARLMSWWIELWFTPTDPTGLHRIRILGGLLFLAWLLPFAGRPEAFFGLNGWFDLKAYQDVADMVRQEGVPPPPLGWSLLFLCGTNTKLLAAFYWGSLAVLILFTLGLATRLTSVLTWLIVISFTANPVAVYDADTLLVMLAFYLMVGYLFLGPWHPHQSWLGRLLGGKDNYLLGWPPVGVTPRESVSANVALRLMQIHFAVGMVACGLHKLQFPEWWSGVAFWMYLHPPFSWNPVKVQEYVHKGTTYLGLLSLALYLTLAWQITFPLFAWRPRWRWLLIGGAAVGWLGAVILYQLPLFGPVLFIFALSYVTPAEWQRLRQWVTRLPVGNPMNTRHGIFLLTAGAAAVCGLTCAPVDLPETPRGKTPLAGTQPMGSTETPPVDPPDSLQGRIEAAISQARQRDLLTTNAFWTIFHGMLGLGLEVTLYNPDTGQRVPALDYISNGGEVRGLRFFPTKYGLDVEGGQLGGPQQAFVGQGHQDQFLAEMAQWGLPTDHKFMVHGKNFTLQDFLNHTKMRARVSAKQELSWAILVIGQYFGTELAWENSEGEKLRFEDLLRYEMRASMDHAACGGTHRLFGLSWVYHLHLRKGGQPIGVWKEVADFTDSYKKKARDQQNPDGSFSVNFFRGPGYLPPDDQHAQVRMNTTGHIFEWLALAMTDEQLREPWVRNAADALAMMFLNIQGKSMEGGTLYHAVHGLIIYYARVFGTDKLAGHIPKVVLLPGCNLKTPGR